MAESERSSEREVESSSHGREQQAQAAMAAASWSVLRAGRVLAVRLIW